MQAELSVIFVDVRGFTELSERIPTPELVARLNRFYELATQAVFALDGTLDKMAGDQVMAFFGHPFRPKDHPQRAVRAALNIVASVGTMDADGEGFRVGAGIGTGEAFVGNVGEEDVRDYTVIGDVVNTAARLQGEAKPGEVLIMETTYLPVAADFPEAPQWSLTLKGKSEPVSVRVLTAC